jgi:hypothetical protein
LDFGEETHADSLSSHITRYHKKPQFASRIGQEC